MSKIKIAKKFKEELLELSLYEEPSKKANDFYNNVLKKRKNLKLTLEEKDKIVNYYNSLIEHNKKLNKFLGNEKYAQFVKETNDEKIIEEIYAIKNILIDNGVLIDNYLTIIKSQPSLFMKYFDGRVEKYGTYDRDINRQYKKATGKNNSENYSLCDFYQWVTNQKIIGEEFINHLNVIEKMYSLKFGEINKGLFDSLFIGHKNWKLITPNTYTFGSLDQSNVYKGCLTYECGTEIKDDYKTFYVPNDIDTAVLHNPYNIKECETLAAVADDMNVILSFFGYTDDKDYQEKQELFNKYLKEFRENDKNKVISLSKVKKKQYVKTIVSIKK